MSLNKKAAVIYLPLGAVIKPSYAAESVASDWLEEILGQFAQENPC